MLPDHQIDHPRPSTPVLYDLSFLPPHLLEPENLAFILGMCDLGTATLVQKRQNKSVSPGTQRTPEAPPLITAAPSAPPTAAVSNLPRAPTTLSPKAWKAVSLTPAKQPGSQSEGGSGERKITSAGPHQCWQDWLGKRGAGGLQLFLNTELGPMP